MATPSTCLYKSPLSWKSWSLVAIVNSLIRVALVDVKVVLVFKPVSTNAFFAKIFTFFSRGTLVKRAVTWIKFGLFQYLIDK